MILQYKVVGTTERIQNIESVRAAFWNFWTDSEQIKVAVTAKLLEFSGKTPEDSNTKDIYSALHKVLLGKIMPLWCQDTATYGQGREAYYFSIEILIGRMLGNNLMNINAEEATKKALEELGFNLEDIINIEEEPGVGNGGLGRLFACFIEAAAAQTLPMQGISLFYRTGFMRQRIASDGSQIEGPDHWSVGSRDGSRRCPEEMVTVHLNGKVETAEVNGKKGVKMRGQIAIQLVPWKIPIIGFNGMINTLTLLSSDVSTNLDPNAKGTDQGWKRMITEQLYPRDRDDHGKWLRFVQEAVLCLGGIRYVLNKKIQALFPNADPKLFQSLPVEQRQMIMKEVMSKLAFQVNDTHPAMIIPELMRILIDECEFTWDDAWELTRNNIGYTNHTVAPEALEKWSVALFENVLPRHFQLVTEINNKFLEDASAKFPGDRDLLERITIIDTREQLVHMARLAIAGSHSTNGVAALHSEIIKTSGKMFKPFARVRPDQFNNKTNGVTHRRFLVHANPELTALISKAIGRDWINEPNLLSRIIEQDLAADDSFVQDYLKIKELKKKQLATFLLRDLGIKINSEHMADIQIKRFHEYKRQLMQALHVMMLLEEYRQGKTNILPRTFIFGGKAAPDYVEAKRIIKLVNYLTKEADRVTNGLIKVVFVPNYNVSWAERLFPATDLSEQISKAGEEASGTGLFKAVFNGGLLIATHDGANIEVAEAVGEDNIFLFGTKVADLHRAYSARDIYYRNSLIKAVLDKLTSLGEYAPITQQLVEHGDPWIVLRDLEEFYRLQEQTVVPLYYNQPSVWAQKAIRAIGGAGRFSADRTIQEYASQIWRINRARQNI